MSLPRRLFLETIPLAGLAPYSALATRIDRKTGMPTRVLGRTGARVSVIGIGCGSRLLSYQDQDKGIEALQKAMDLGVNYIDTAFSYGGGKSETWVGQAIRGRRKGLWIATKMSERDGAKAMKIIEGSLRRLGVDHVDLIHVHALAGPEDLAKVEAPGGLLETLRKAREQKLTRFIGVTSHTDPVTLRTAIERHDFDCTQMALNAGLVGMRSGKGGMVIDRELKESFETIALPAALRKKMGVTAMKIFAADGLVGAAPPATLLQYGLSLPVATAVLGMPRLEYIAENVALAKAFKPLGREEMRELSERLSRQHKARLDHYFRDHADA